MKYFHRKGGMIREFIMSDTCVTWSPALSVNADENVWSTVLIRRINQLYLGTTHIYLYVSPGFRAQSSPVNDLDACGGHCKLNNKSAFNYLTIYGQNT